MVMEKSLGAGSEAKRGAAGISRGLLWLMVALAAGGVFFANQRFGAAAMGTAFQDDFYYYATVARSLALHGRSSFDGIHLTNGYHPLWLGILTVLTWVNRAAPAGPRMALSVECVQTALLVAIVALVGKIARRVCAGPWALTLEVLTASLAVILLRSGMEAGLAVAAAFALLAYRTRWEFPWSVRNGLGYGLLAGVLVLSRLDAALLVVLLIVLDLLPAVGTRLASLRVLGSFAAGMLPVGLYLWLNEHVFGMLLPVSGAAKQLRRHHTPSARALGSFADQIFHGKNPVYALYAVLTVVALGVLVARIAKGRGAGKAMPVGVVLAVLLFPFAQMLAVSCLSDWPVWDWYLYPWPMAGVLAALVLLPGAADTTAPWERVGRAAFAGSLLLFGVYSLLLLMGTNPGQNLTYTAGEQIARFAAGHPGVYAMGDRAGAVGYLSPQPVIQLEGLMMDRAYLENVREERDLKTVLRSYGVRYYISEEYPDRLGRCFTAREPVQAGPDSPVMMGSFCSRPVAVIPDGYLTNRIFDLTLPE